MHIGPHRRCQRPPLCFTWYLPRRLKASRQGTNKNAACRRNECVGLRAMACGSQKADAVLETIF